MGFRNGAVAATVALTAVGAAFAQTPPEPGATPGVGLVNISRNSQRFASVFPQVAVSRADPNLVAVAWRRYNLPIDTNAPKPDRVAECHLALSRDGGRSFRDRNMMDVLRTRKDGSEPELWGCNAPWVSIARDGVLYFGGALFTAGGELAAEPKAGRAGVTVSTDGGATWSKMVPGITLARLAPGLKGLGGGMQQQDTPWDGANGVADPATGVFYSTAGAYIAASDDHAKSFGTVYAGKGAIAAAFGTVVATRTVMQRAGSACPCLVFSLSKDRGRTWSEQVIAEAKDYNREGTIRYPVSAASPAEPGHYAVAGYAPDHKTVKVWSTADGGETWQVAAQAPYPANVPVANANQAGVGYTTDGKVLVTWRGFRNPGAFNTFVAMVEGARFGPVVKVSPELSMYPPLTYAGNYGNGNGGGDFTTWVSGSAQAAFVAFPYSPGGAVEDTWLARVPLALLGGQAAPAAHAANR